MPAPAPVDIVTQHGNNARTGHYGSESALTLANVRQATFGRMGFFATDGQVDAQPLFLSGVNVPGVGVRDVLYVVTQRASVYAFDAVTGAQLWKVTALGPGETPGDSRNCDLPQIGITATPVIDRSRGTNGALYLVAKSMTGSDYFQRIHALDITTGAELSGSPREITASYPGTGANSANGQVLFDPGMDFVRPGLVLAYGAIHTAWTSQCDLDPYTAWIMSFDAATLTQTSVLNITPNGSRGAFWMAGAGVAADSAGAIYMISGNGTFGETLDASGFPVNGNYGNALLKLGTSGGQLSVADYFATSDTNVQSDNDNDFGSGGVMLLPDLVDGGGSTRRLAIGAGKDTNIYVLDRDALGKYDPNVNSNNAYQKISGQLLDGVWGAPAWFNGAVYYGARGDSIKAFRMSSARLASTPSSRTTMTFRYPGTTPSVSSNGNANGIVWATENGNPGVLHAFDAADLSRELYHSNQAANGRDQFGPVGRFATPVIARGRVYIATPNGVVVFGLLP